MSTHQIEHSIRLVRPSPQSIGSLPFSRVSIMATISFRAGAMSTASGICPVADSRTARWWPTELPGGGQVFCPLG